MRTLIRSAAGTCLAAALVACGPGTSMDMDAGTMETGTGSETGPRETGPGDTGGGARCNGIAIENNPSPPPK